MVFIPILLIILAYVFVGVIVYKIGMILPFEKNEDYFNLIMWLATTWTVSIPFVLFFGFIIGIVLSISLIIRSFKREKL